MAALQRLLAREKIDERRHALFRASGITTHRQLLQRPLWDVAHAMDMSVCEAEELVAKLSIRLAPAGRSAFDLFLDSVNHPMVLRTGLPGIDQALNGGLHCRAVSEFAGTDGIGKSQVAMTLAVMCALDYPDNTVMFFDTEHNFSAKRLLQIAIARIRQTNAGQEADINEVAASVVRRIRVVKVNSVAAFQAKFKEVQSVTHLLQIKLLIVDCVTSLYAKAHGLSHAQRQHQMLRLIRDLKVFADTYQVFVAVTNRATTVESDDGLYTKPQLGDTWAHCVTTRFVMERHSLYRAITIAKSSVAGYVVQPFQIKEGGVETVADENSSAASDDFTFQDELLRDMTLGALPTVEPECTLRSTQQSNADDLDDTELDAQCDVAGQTRQEEDVQETDRSSFDIVSDSNSEEDSESIDWDVGADV
ncbi:unnamed protein product [Hyaloperonospora brassicae]|uniref:RecA family profile 1 domain-containing protein n=1 Tax=Hyaloperonospora brassicae TaxID=162125 RepID=A0AAV0U4M3_HYABA|nr:unnamed protein product [Hyaloperonospora brassicae]